MTGASSDNKAPTHLRIPFRRGHGSRRLLDEAALPEPCTELIQTVARRARLWPGERADVTRELIDHARDALAAGQTPEQIVERFGDPSQAAALIARARKRQRHPLLAAWAVAVKLAAFTPIAVVGVYAILFARFHAASPTVRTNYFAMIDEARPDPASLVVEGFLPHRTYNMARVTWDDFVADQKAAIEGAPFDEDLPRTAAEDPRRIGRGHPEFQATASKIRALRPLLDRVAAAAAMPDHGTPFTSEYGAAQAEDRTLPIEARLNAFASTPNDPEDQRPLFEVMLPHLADMRRCAMLLAFDARLALDESDAERAIGRWMALLDLAEQAQADGFVISSLVAIAIHESATQEIRRGLHRHPDTLTEEQIGTIESRLVASGPATLRFSLDAERLMIDDILQRTFTDDGNGNGRITPEGFRAIHDLAGSGDRTGETLRSATLPATATIVADRATQRRIMLDAFDRIEAAAERAPNEPSPDNPDASVFRRDADRRIDPYRYIIPYTFQPAMGRAFQNLHAARLQLDATRAALAAELFRRSIGEYPETIDDLVPGYLGAPAPDPFDPGEPLRLEAVPGGFVIYSVGENGVDDGGTPVLGNTGRDAGRPIPHRFWARFGAGTPYETGDWILFPPDSID
ncbi:MAG: hypothetical protein AAFR96_03185 [Planctomycetota bacterium]